MGLVPYLIGFHPEESLVVLVIEHGQVAVTARVDLIGVAESWSLTELVSRLFDRFPSATGWFIAYTDNTSLAWDVLSGCADLAGEMRLGRLLQVGARTWRADFPDGPSGELTDRVSAVAAEAAVLGLPARASRKALAECVAGPPESELDALRARFATLAVEVERLGRRGRRRVLQRLLNSARPLPVGDCVRLALLAERPEGQLAVLRALTPGTAAHQLSVWTRVVRHCVPGYQPAVLGLLGVAAWQTGDGALQMVCLERLDRIDPLAPIAALLDWLNAVVLPPDQWLQSRESLVRSLEEHFTIAGRPATRPGR